MCFYSAKGTKKQDRKEKLVRCSVYNYFILFNSVWKAGNGLYWLSSLRLINPNQASKRNTGNTETSPSGLFACCVGITGFDKLNVSGQGHLKCFGVSNSCYLRCVYDSNSRKWWKQLFCPEKDKSCKCVICFGCCHRFSIWASYWVEIISSARRPQLYLRGQVGRKRFWEGEMRSSGPSKTDKWICMSKEGREKEMRREWSKKKKVADTAMQVALLQKVKCIMLRKQESKWKQMCLFTVTHMHSYYK